MMYEVIFRVADANGLAVLMQACSNSAGIDFMSASPATTDQPEVPTTPARQRYKNGVKNKGISGVDLLAEVIADGKRHRLSEIEKQFARRGFAPKSAGATISREHTAGRVKRDGEFVSKPA